MLKKFKSILTDEGLFHTLLVIIVAVASFGLGRQSVIESSVSSNKATVSLSAVKSALHVSSASSSVVEPESSFVSGALVTVVASKSGSRYHYSHCSGAKQIKSENIITFQSPAAAEAAGYTLAANCTPK